MRNISIEAPNKLAFLFDNLVAIDQQHTWWTRSSVVLIAEKVLVPSPEQIRGTWN